MELLEFCKAKRRSSVTVLEPGRRSHLQKCQRKPSASSGGMNLARREATRSGVDFPMPVHDLDLANTSTCRALEIECRNERSTGSGLIRPLNKRRGLIVMLARAG